MLDGGFTLPEIMFVVLIIGILLTIAIPTFVAAVGAADTKACFSNQRTIEGVTNTWLLDPNHNTVSSLAGVVNLSHTFVAGGYILRAPHCPNAPVPVVLSDPTAAEGAYTLDSSGSVIPCVFGSLGPHGSYDAP